MKFHKVLLRLQDGERFRRDSWEAGSFIFLVPGSSFKVNRSPLLGIYPEGTEIQYHPHIDMKTAQGYVVPWVASQSDLFADDWEIVILEHSLEELEEESKKYFSEEPELIEKIEDKRTEKEKEEEVRAILQKLNEYQNSHETGFVRKFDYEKLEIDGKDFPVDEGKIDPEAVEEIERIRIELEYQQTQEMLYNVYESLDKKFPGEYQKEDFTLEVRPGEESLFDHSFDSSDAIDKLETARIHEQQTPIPQTIGDIVKQTKENMK